MVEKARTQSALTGRPLKERVIGQAREVAGLVDRLPDESDAPALEGDVSSSLETIHRVTQTYAVLLDKLSAYEGRVRELSHSLGEATLAKEEAQNALADVQREARAERQRAAAAREEADAAGAHVAELERELAALRAQTSKLMSAVDQLFPDLDAPDAEHGPKGLRVVR